MERKEELLGNFVGIYFASKSSLASNKFTKILAERYGQCKEKRYPFEVVFVSDDRDEAEFDSHVKEMEKMGGDWLSIPFDETARRVNMRGMFSVDTVPRFVLIDGFGKVLNPDGQVMLTDDTDCVRFPWPTPRIAPMESPEGLGDAVALLVFAEGLRDDEKEDIQEDLEAFVLHESGKTMKLFLGLNSTGATPRLREMVGLPPAVHLDRTRASQRHGKQPVAEMAILDLQNHGAFYQQRPGDHVTEAGIEAFVAAFAAGKLPRQQLHPKGGVVIGKGTPAPARPPPITFPIDGRD